MRNRSPLLFFIWGKSMTLHEPFSKVQILIMVHQVWVRSQPYVGKGYVIRLGFHKVHHYQNLNYRGYKLYSIHTGLHQERAYTCFPLMLYMHFIVYWCMHWVPWYSMGTPEVFGVRIECPWHSMCTSQNNRNACMRRKQLDWCMHWGQEIPKQVYTLSWCKPVTVLCDVCRTVCPSNAKSPPCIKKNNP